MNNSRYASEEYVLGILKSRVEVLVGFGVTPLLKYSKSGTRCCYTEITPVSRPYSMLYVAR